MAISKIASAGITADFSNTLTAADLAADSVDSSELVNGSIDTAHLSADCVDGTKIADDAVDSEHYAAGSIDAAHLHTNAVFASGVKMIFQQTAAPTGWTKVTGSGNDNALRITTGTVGTGGSVAFETAFASVTPTITMSNAAVTLADATMPYHSHAVNAKGTTGTPGPTGSAAISTISVGTQYYFTNSFVAGPTNPAGAGGAHTHTNTAASSAVNLDVSYVDVIVATKD